MKKILFITGTRAEYGKLKPLMKAVEETDDFECNIYVSGMHLVKRLGSTFKEILKDGYENVYIDFAQVMKGIMSYDLGIVISNLTNYVQHICPDMIVVHGDRSDALAGAIVGAFNNIITVHIEGGEVSGTIDESIRHAVSKFSHFHLVSNKDARRRLLQMGEREDSIRIIGSPDIDIMLSSELPTLSQVKSKYDIPFDDYGILAYHPVTTEVDTLQEKAEKVVTAVLNSDKNYVVIYPNNDMGFEFIIGAYKKFENDPRFKVFPSVRFEYFLTLMKNAEFVIGNSSAGIRETEIYGIPTIDIGSRQNGRYSINNSNIQHVEEDDKEILGAIKNISKSKETHSNFGNGNSTENFMRFLRDSSIWSADLQKVFIDR